MWIKICGITSLDDARAVVDAGADAIGLNFYPRSRRFVDPEIGRQIADSCREFLDVVGVFVNESPKDVARVAINTGLTAVQFHGDETPRDVSEFQRLCPEIAAVRAFRVGRQTPSIQQQMNDYRALTAPLAGVLADAWSDREYGGTGERIANDLLAGHRDVIPRLILAGGLRPDNVGAAVDQIQPWGVDTASGVETAPGVKSVDLIKQFVAHCRNAAPGEARSTITAG